MANPKTWLSYADQLDLLKRRGLVVSDDAKAMSCLERIGYYRLSAYWYPFRVRSGPVILLSPTGGKPDKPKEEILVFDEFVPGCSFSDAVKLYVFDKTLRILALDALERVEIALRVDISHTLGNLDPFAYLRSELFHSTFSIDLDVETGITRHHQWLGGHARLIQRSKEDFVRHNKKKYGLPLPVWVACEVWDFGTMSTLYGGMRETEQDSISAKYGIYNGRIFATWLRCLNYLRNVCAHHSRLWNRNMDVQPKLPPKEEVPWVAHFENDKHLQARCYLLLTMLKHLIAVIHPSSTYSQRLDAHLQSFRQMPHVHVDLKAMGVPSLALEPHGGG